MKSDARFKPIGWARCHGLERTVNVPVFRRNRRGSLARGRRMLDKLDFAFVVGVQP